MEVSPSIILAFLAGVVTVVTPCVLPILPPLLAGSVGNKLRPLFIVLGSAVTFTLMGGLFSIIGIATGSIGNSLRLIFIALIIGFGIIWVDDEIGNIYTKYSTISVNKLFRRPAPSGEESLAGAFILGLSLGIVWIPCVGPILGAVLSFVAMEGNLVFGSVMLIAYSIGLGIPMLAIAYGSKRLGSHIEWTKNNSQKIKKIAGIILILTGVAMLFGFDQLIQTILLPYFPEFETKILELLG